MPYLGEDKAPLPKTNSKPQKMDLVKGSWLKGGEAGIRDINSYFRRQNVRSDLKRRLMIPQNDTAQLNKEIEDLKKRIKRINNFRTGAIEPSEIKNSKFQADKYWEPKREARKKSEGGWTKSEIIQMKRLAKKYEFLEEKFGK